MKQLRLAQSGSGFLAPVHVGSLMAIRDFDCEIVQDLSTSGGSVVSGIFAAGMSVDDMKTLSLTADFSSFFTFCPLSPIEQAAFCNGNDLLKWLQIQTKNKRFCDVDMDIGFVATDLIQGGKVVLSKANYPNMPLALAIRASAAIPFAYAGVEYAGMYLTDGGTSSNLDLADLIQDDIPKLGVELTRKIVPMAPGPHSAITLAKRHIEITLSQAESAQEKIGELENAKIATVDVTGFDMLDTRMSLADRTILLNRGYDATMLALKSMKFPSES